MSNLGNCQSSFPLKRIGGWGLAVTIFVTGLWALFVFLKDLPQ